MLESASTRTRGTRRQPQASRHAILQAALAEFAQEGLAGARMDAIASAAGVNKALLYYYFQDKDALYGAVLDQFFAAMSARVLATLESAQPAGERLLTYVRAHFDSVAESVHDARLFQRELMSAGRGVSPHLARVVEQYVRPISQRVLSVLEEGIRNGEFRPVDVAQFAPSMIGIIVHYFVVAPVMRRLRPGDPFSPEAIRTRRAAVLDMIAAALFADRAAGLKLASKIARDESVQLPMGHKIQKAKHRERMRRKA